MRGHHSIPYAIFLVIMISLAPGECAMAEEAKSPGRSVEERHELGLFLGGTHRGSENGFAAGLDYEYRISPLFGFGGLIEFTGGDIRDGVLGFPFFFHVH